MPSRIALTTLAAILLAIVTLAGLTTYQVNERPSTYNAKPERPSASVTGDTQLADYTFWLMLFTGVLAVGTLALWSVTERTLQHGREDSARQARESEAHLAVATATQRAWLGFADIQRWGAIDVLGKNFQVTFNLTVHNYGHSPATSVSIEAEVIAADAFNRQSAVTWEGFRRAGKLRQGNIGNIIVFPNDDVSQELSVLVPVNRTDGDMVLLFIGVFYRVIGDSQPHETCEVMCVDNIPAELPFDYVSAFTVRHTLIPATID